MPHRMTLALAVILGGLIWVLPCWADYSIGLALPTARSDNAQLIRDIKRALSLFQEQLKGELGEKLAREYKIQPPNVVFVTKECPANDIPCAAQIAEAFAKSDCVGVIGHMFSGPAIAAGRIYDREKMVLITPTATHPEVAKTSNRVFRMTFNDEWQGAVIAAYVYRILKRTKVAVVYEKNIYGKGLYESFLKQVHKMGFRPIGTIGVDSSSQHSSATLMRNSFAALDSADAVVLFTYRPMALKIFPEIRARNAHAPVIGSDDLLAGTFADDMERIVRRLKLQEAGLMVASPFFYELAPLKAYEFKRLYEKRYSPEPQETEHDRTPQGQARWGPGPYPALFVDAALLITRGIMDGLSKERHTVKALRDQIFRYLESLDSPERAVDGITGSLYFNAEGDMLRPVLFGWLKGKRFQPAFSQLALVYPLRQHSSSKLDSAKAAPDDEPVSIVVNGVQLKPRHVVYTGLNFYRIDRIDLRSQSFEAEFFLWFKWQQPRDLLINRDSIFFWNSFYSSDDQVVQIEDRVEGDMTYKAFRIKSGFMDEYDLRNYPFDSQVLTLRMGLPRYESDQVLLVVDEEADFAADQFKIFPKEYRLVGRPEHASGTLPLNATFGDPDRKPAGKRHYEYSVYQVRFVVARMPFPYLLKMFLPLMVLIGICLAVFWVPVKYFSVRITLVMTALLSAIVFHMSRATRLPNVGYLTLADKFFVVSYVVMSATIAATISIEWLVQKEAAHRAATINSGSRYLLTAGTVFTFLTLALPAIERWYSRGLVGVGLLFSIWLVYEFLRHNPSVGTRIKSYLLLSRFRGS